MIKELKYLFYIIVIFFFTFFIARYYFSDENYKNSYRSTSLLDEKIKEAEKDTLEFLQDWVPNGASPLCGNSVHQDRRFLRLEMSDIESYLHYRIIDVSSIKEVVSRWYEKKAYFPIKPKTHLALDDIRESIKELEWYRNKVFVDTIKSN